MSGYCCPYLNVHPVVVGNVITSTRSLPTIASLIRVCVCVCVCVCEAVCVGGEGLGMRLCVEGGKAWE